MSFAPAPRSSNYFRFLPCREKGKQDGKYIFTAARYARNAIENPGEGQHGFRAGIMIGPGIQLPTADSTPGFKTSPGGVIVPACANEKADTIRVRDFTPKVKEGEEARTLQFADWLALDKDPEGAVRALPYDYDSSDPYAVFEIWTGLLYKSERLYQLIQGGLFQHGAVSYMGSTAPVVDASAEQGSDVVSEDPEDADVFRATAAELYAQKMGEMVEGMPLWIARVFKVRFSPQDSEVVLVRQFNQFWLCHMKDSTFTAKSVPAVRFEKQFETLTVDQKLVPTVQVAA